MDMILPTSASVTRSLWILLMCSTLAFASDCPRNAMQQAKACTAVLGLQSAQGSPNEFIQEGDGQKAYHACTNGDLLNAINCQERILERCKDDNTDSAHFLRKMIDIEKSRRAVIYFCTNVGVYMKNSKCIAAHHAEQVSCAETAMSNLKTQFAATRNKDALLRFQCRFYFEAVRCTEDILTKHCSSYVSDVVTTIMIGFEPPICNNTRSTQIKSVNPEARYDTQPGGDNNDRSTAPHTQRNCLAHFIIFLVCVYRTFAR